MNNSLELVKFELRTNTRFYQELVMDAWKWIEIDEPVEKRIDNYDNNHNYWNHHVALAAISFITKPDKYLEVGSRIGASAAVVRNATFTHTTAIDLWKPYTSKTLPETKEFFIQQMSINSDPIDIIQGNSHVILPALFPEKYELILVDGDHSEKGAAQDLEDCYKLLAPNGFIVFDDIMNQGCMYLKKVAEEFATNHPDLLSLWNLADDNGTVIFQKLSK